MSRRKRSEDGEIPRQEAGLAIDLDPDQSVIDPLDLYVDVAPKDGVTMGGKVDRGLAARVSEVIHSGVLPFKTSSDYVRAALHWFTVQKVAKYMGARFEQDVRLATAAILATQKRKRLANVEQLVEAHVATIAQFLRHGAVQQAVEEYRRAEGAVEECFVEPFRAIGLHMLHSRGDLAQVREVSEQMKAGE